MKYDYINEHKEKGGIKINLFNKKDFFLTSNKNKNFELEYDYYNPKKLKFKRQLFDNSEIKNKIKRIRMYDKNILINVLIHFKRIILYNKIFIYNLLKLDKFVKIYKYFFLLITYL